MLQTCIAMGKTCSSLCTKLCKIFSNDIASLKDMTLKLGHLANFKVLFPAESMLFATCCISKFKINVKKRPEGRSFKFVCKVVSSFIV